MLDASTVSPWPGQRPTVKNWSMFTLPTTHSRWPLITTGGEKPPTHVAQSYPRGTMKTLAWASSRSPAVAATATLASLLPPR